MFDRRNLLSIAAQKLHVLFARTDRELEAAFWNPVQLKVGAVAIGTDLFSQAAASNLQR